MKLGINEIREGIYEAAVAKTIRQLKQEGFKVEREYYYSMYDNQHVNFDLFAYNDAEKRIYEFKIGKNRIGREQFEFLQRCAKNLQAKLYVIYLEVPRSKSIYFENIEQIIFNNFVDDPPEILQELATHVSIENIANIDIEQINVDNEIVNLRGSGNVILQLQIGSRSDLRNRDGYEETVEFEFFFRLKLDVTNRIILSRYYKVDTAWYFD